MVASTRFFLYCLNTEIAWRFTEESKDHVFRVKIYKNEDFMIQCLKIWRVYEYGKLAKEITV
jgi:hypothetical protein